MWRNVSHLNVGSQSLRFLLWVIFPTVKIHEYSADSFSLLSILKVPATFGDYIDSHLKPQSRESLGNETMYLFGDLDQKLWAPLLKEYKLPKWSLPGHSPAVSFGIAGPGAIPVCLNAFIVVLGWRFFRNWGAVSFSRTRFCWSDLRFKEMVLVSLWRATGFWAGPHNHGMVRLKHRETSLYYTCVSYLLTFQVLGCLSFLAAREASTGVFNEAWRSHLLSGQVVACYP